MACCKNKIKKFATTASIAIGVISLITLSLFLFKCLDGYLARENGVYISLSTKQVLDDIPSEVSEGDVYLKGDYAYLYCPSEWVVDGWHVELATEDLIESYFEFNDTTISDCIRSYAYTTLEQTSYGEILSEIGNKQTKCLYGIFADCWSLTEPPVIPDNVINISGAFQRCFALKQAPTIPAGVIGMTYAFESCTELISAPVIPSGVVNLECTFWECKKLTQAPVIPNGVTSLFATFDGCSNLIQPPYIPDSVENMNSTFSRCIAMRSAPTIPDGVKYMFSTFSWCESITEAPSIPDSVIAMSNTFAYCTNLTQAPSIPSNVWRTDGMFRNCTSLTGSIEFNASPSRYEECFDGVDFQAQQLTLVGTPSKIDFVGTTGVGYCVKCRGVCDIEHKNILENGTYYVGVTSTKAGDYTGAAKTYVVGDELPPVAQGDVYINGNYEYRYGYSYNGTRWKNDEHIGWGVRCLANTQSPGEIISLINNKYVTDMNSTFSCCSALVESPTIPNSIVDMTNTFSECVSLIQAPEIPHGVTRMERTFKGCSSLTTVYCIPNSVSNLRGTFDSCLNLKGPIEINTIDFLCRDCFSGVDMSRITIVGEIAKHIDVLNVVGSTGENWVNK